MGIYHCSYSRIPEPAIYSYVYKSDGFSLTPNKTKCFFPNGPITWTISLDRMIQEEKEENILGNFTLMKVRVGRTKHAYTQNDMKNHWLKWLPEPWDASTQDTCLRNLGPSPLNIVLAIHESNYMPHFKRFMTMLKPEN